MCQFCDVADALKEILEPTFPDYGIVITHKGEADTASLSIEDQIEKGDWILLEDPTDYVESGNVLMIPCTAPGVVDWPTEDAPQELKERAAMAAYILQEAGFLSR